MQQWYLPATCKLGLGLNLVVEESGQPKHQDVERQTNHKLIGGQAMAHLGLHASDDQSTCNTGHECDQHRVGEVVANGAGEGAAKQHPLDRDVQRAGAFGNELT